MNSSSKSSCLQSYRLLMYNRALHPELFKVVGRRNIEHQAYEFECWVMPGGHLMRFQHENACATEIIIAQDEGIPDRGILAAMPCAGEREHEQAFGDKLKSFVTVQTETLPDTLYSATYAELTQFGKEGGALMHLWRDEDGGKCASILDIQRYRREVHAQAYHLIASGGIVLRSQSIFEHAT